MTIYKVLNEDGSRRNNGVGSWPLPVKNADGTWTPGEWLEVEGELVLCENGLHLCDGEGQLMEWIGPAIFEAEYDGERRDGDDKFVVRRARLLRLFETWNERTARLFACDCAERVLHIFEGEHPDDKRPRNTIEASRRYANGQATREEFDVEWDAAWYAAWDAAWYAAWYAAAAGDAERKWQAERLAQYLAGRRNDGL